MPSVGRPQKTRCISSETNSAKSAGARVDYSPSTTTTFSYFNYLGDEAPDSAAHRQLRSYNGVGIKSALSSQFLVMAEVDYGTQGHASGSGTSTWYGGMLTGRYQATPTAAIVGRVEREIRRQAGWRPYAA